MVQVVDADRDGRISEDDIHKSTEMLELELREEKADSQRRMAWVAILSMIIFTTALFSPLVSETRVAALADLLGLFYIAQAGVVGAYMGVTAWMSKTSSSTTSRFAPIMTARKVPQNNDPEL